MIKGANNIFSNQSGLSGLSETWITPGKMYGDFVFFFLQQLFKLCVIITMMTKIFGWPSPLTLKAFFFYFPWQK